jgi:hypothetical protein
MNLCAFALNWSRKAADELVIRPKFPATHVHAISIEGDTKKIVLRERKIGFYLTLFYEYFQGGNGSWAWGKPPGRLGGDRRPGDAHVCDRHSSAGGRARADATLLSLTLPGQRWLSNNCGIRLANSTGAFRCQGEDVFQTVVQRAEHLMLHHRDLISLVDQIFRLVARNLIGSVRLRNADQIGG